MKYHITYTREFTTEIQAESSEAAKQVADSIIKQFPAGTIRLLSIYADGYVDKPCPGCEYKHAAPWDKPPAPFDSPPGGSFGGAKPKDIPAPVDQIAAVA
jgi:hypothetical protein